MKQELDFKRISIFVGSIAIFFVLFFSFFLIFRKLTSVEDAKAPSEKAAVSVSKEYVAEKNKGFEKEENVIRQKEAIAVDPQEGFFFAVLGDTQRFDAGNPSGGLQKSVENISRMEVGLVMTVGDLLSSCEGGSKCEKKYSQWKGALGDLYPKTYEVMGNHDRTGKKDADETWQKVFDLPRNGPKGYEEFVYSFDFENSHFVVLNSEKPKEHEIDREQINWLKKDLSSTDKENVFVFFHEPAYPVSSKIGDSLDSEEKERDELWRILKDNKVTAVFNGHEHIYSRRKVDGVYQFVIGNTDSFDHDLPAKGMADFAYQGKHFAIVGVEDKKVTIKLYSSDGKLVDEFSFSEE